MFVELSTDSLEDLHIQIWVRVETSKKDSKKIISLGFLKKYYID